MKYCVMIPSKLRPDVKKFKTIHILSSDEDVVIPVEPQEFSNYKKEFKNYDGVKIISIGENDKGLGYARWWSQVEATKNRFDILWLMDDDITGINIREGKTPGGNFKLRKIAKDSEWKEFFSSLNELILEKNISQLGISFIASNWMHEKEVKFNARCTQVFALNLEHLKENDVFFDKDQILYSDYEFTLNQLQNGLKTCRNYTYAFDTPLMGSNDGGCQAIRSNERSEKMCDRLINMYGRTVVSKFYSEKHKVWEPKITWSKVIRRKSHEWW